MLTGRKGLAKTSGTPGKTRNINLFAIDNGWQIADLPGYGYARISKSERKRWQSLVEGYMLHRPNLVSAFVLVDLRHPLQNSDEEFINWMGERRVPFCLVYTKADKIPKSKIQSHVLRIGKTLLENWDALPASFVTSAETGQGRDELLEYIAKWNRETELA